MNRPWPFSFRCETGCDQTVTVDRRIAELVATHYPDAHLRVCHGYIGEDVTHSLGLVYYSPGTFNGKIYRVTSDEPCAVDGHDLEEIDNYGTPTGTYMCYECHGLSSWNDEWQNDAPSRPDPAP